MLLGPCALCFVENRHVLDFRISVVWVTVYFTGIDLQGPVYNRFFQLAERSVAIMMNYLDERFYIPSRRGYGVTLIRIAFFLLPLFVPRQCFAQNRDQRLISGEVNRQISFLELAHRNIQADQRFACTRNAGDKADRLFVIGPRVVDHVHHKFARTLQIFARSLGLGDLSDRVVQIERTRRLNDRRSRHIAAEHPSAQINVLRALRREASDYFGQGRRIGEKRFKNMVVVWRGFHAYRSVGGIGCDQNRNYRQIAAGFMKVFQVERIIPNLFPILAGIFVCTNFKF